MAYIEKWFTEDERLLQRPDMIRPDRILYVFPFIKLFTLFRITFKQHKQNFISIFKQHQKCLNTRTFNICFDDWRIKTLMVWSRKAWDMSSESLLRFDE